MIRPDLLVRISELAGEPVAEQVASEFGGEAHYIRKSLKPGKTVRCGDCTHHVSEESGFGYMPKTSCGLTQKWTSLSSWRSCNKFTPPNTDLDHLAKHFGISIEEITQIAAGRKAA